MWEVENRTPFGCVGYFVCDLNGAEYWAVAATALFGIRDDGLLAIAEKQRQPLLAPLYRDKEARELWVEADLSPFRPRPDIIVSGVACRPDMAPFRRHEAWIKVGVLEKRASFFGARRLRKTKERVLVERGPDIAEAPLSWTAALGGPDVLDPAAEPHDHNPIGMGWTTRWERLPDGVEIDLPFIENPAHPIAIGEPLPAQHGFGALQPAWRPRRDHAGTYDDAWRKSRAPLLPQDFSDDFHQSALPDQIYPGALQGGAPVEIDGFHRDGPYRFHLPQMILEARTRIGSERSGARMRLIGVAIEATQKMLRLTYNAHTPCNGRDHLVEGSIVSIRQMAGVAR